MTALNLVHMAVNGILLQSEITQPNRVASLDTSLQRHQKKLLQDTSTALHSQLHIKWLHPKLTLKTHLGGLHSHPKEATMNGGVTDSPQPHSARTPATTTPRTGAAPTSTPPRTGGGTMLASVGYMEPVYTGKLWSVRNATHKHC